MRQGRAACTEDCPVSPIVAVAQKFLIGLLMSDQVNAQDGQHTSTERNFKTEHLTVQASVLIRKLRSTGTVQVIQEAGEQEFVSILSVVQPASHSIPLLVFRRKDEIAVPALLIRNPSERHRAHSGLVNTDSFVAWILGICSVVTPPLSQVGGFTSEGRVRNNPSACKCQIGVA